MTPGAACGPIHYRRPVTNPVRTMPRFRFTAVDSSGTPHDGTIDAATADAARNKLASNGLAVRTVEEVDSAPGLGAPELSRPTGPRVKGNPQPAPVPVLARVAEPSHEEARGGSRLPLVVAMIALLVSLGTAAFTIFGRDRDREVGGGSRLARYDFNTPEKAYNSSLKMAASGDVLARMELNGKFAAPQAREQLNSMVVRKTVDHDGKKALFVRFERHGREQRKVRWFERDPDTGMWRRAYSLEFGGGANALPEALAQDIEEWVTHDLDDPLGPDVDW